VLLPMANYGLKLYGSAIVVNSKFAAEKPDAVKAFLRAFVKGLRDTVKNPAVAVESVLKREDVTKKEVELERLRMAIRDDIVTPEVKANGFGPIDEVRLEEAINQIGLAYPFKAKPKADDIFDSSFLPSTADRKVN
jgi:NitT/TauT family transport system substrate-binding protein